jgi:hypothetical protein
MKKPPASSDIKEISQSKFKTAVFAARATRHNLVFVEHGLPELVAFRC